MGTQAVAEPLAIGANMKIVINKCYGGFSLSAKAIARLAELQGRKAYFFRSLGYKKGYAPVANPLKDDFIEAFDTPEVLYHTIKQPLEANAWYQAHNLTCRPEDRSDPLLVQVVEELGEEADGPCAALRIVEIPNGTNWEIDDYDGNESISESHRSWG